MIPFELCQGGAKKTGSSSYRDVSTSHIFKWPETSSQIHLETETMNFS